MPMKLSSLVILAVLAGSASTAAAEVVVVNGIELQLPPEWVRKDSGPRTMLGPKKHKGRAIEVIPLAAMPPVEPEAFKELLGGEQLQLSGVKELTREGTRMIVASGKLIVPKKLQADIDVIVVPVEGRAAMLVSFVGTDQDPLIRKANREILATARVPGPRISVGVKPPRTAGMVTPPQKVIDAIGKFVGVIDASFRMPRPLAITFEECGQVNAFYSQARHTITMCHDLYDELLKLFARLGLEPAKAERTARGAFSFVFMHELGHALVGELALPITGKGEDVADEIATLLLSKGKAQEVALSGAAWFEAKIKQPGHQDIYWSTHSFDSVRFESILCLLYGADKAAHAELMKQHGVPAKKLAKCERDTPLRMKAWEKMLAPYALKK